MHNCTLCCGTSCLTMLLHLFHCQTWSGPILKGLSHVWLWWQQVVVAGGKKMR